MMTKKKILTGLKSADYEHPHDKKALSALEKAPGLEIVGRYITKHTLERIYTIQYTGSNIRVTKDSYPKIYKKLECASQVLDLNKIPDMYIQWGYHINACTIGAEHPAIILDSGVLDLCDDDEALFVIGRECGHIKSDHMLYHMMAQLINNIIDAIPFGSIAAGPLQYALYYWSRMSEFTADRAGLLCCQNKDAAIRALMKMAGVPINHFNDLNCNAFIEQAKEFKQLDYEAMNKVVKFISIADASHPWTVMRVAELLNWIATKEYNRFMAGDYDVLVYSSVRNIINSF